jgi:uncharacterized protein
MSSRKQRGHRLLVAGLGLGAFAILPALAAADGLDARRAVIVAQGTGEVHIQPDSIRVTLSVEAQADTLDAATSQVSTAMSAVLDAVHRLALPGLAIETQQVQFSPVYGGNTVQTITAYGASNQIQVTLQNVAEAELAADAAEIVDAALHAGANRLGGVEFFRADPSAAEDKALTLAVQNAKQDAETMARAAGVTLTGPVSIEESSASRVPLVGADFAATISTPIEAPALDVQANVTVKYGFE